MAVHRITSRTRHVLVQSSHTEARRFGAIELAGEHILRAMLVDYPRECESASLRAGTVYDSITTAVLRRLDGPASEEATIDDQTLLPPSRGARRLFEDALWLAHSRGTGICGLGDLFYAGLLAMAPEVVGADPFEMSQTRLQTLWGLAWDFGEPPFGQRRAQTP